MMGANHGMDLSGLRHLQRQSPQLFAMALEKPAIQMLTWMNTGSPREPVTPPLKTGALKGSGSAFVGPKLVGTTPPATGATPAQSGNAPPLAVHWVFNTEYAAKMHEFPDSYSELSQAAGATGNKWMEKHISADRDAFIEFIEKEFAKGLDKLGANL